MVEVMKQGLETSIQELPGRIGYWEQGFPPSGPADTWSFRLANLLVGNEADTAALESQFIGPTLRFQGDGHVAVTGADMALTLDGVPVAMWETIAVRAGQVLACGAARTGARSYIAIAGGIDSEPVLGSRATFHMAGIGGIDGGAIKAGQVLPLAAARPGTALRRVREDARPPIGDPAFQVAAMLGPNDAWLDQQAIDRFFASEWIVQARSNRTGVRLTGPEFSFAEPAYKKRPEHGRDPSNILDHGYPIGAISIAGQTPIVLLCDSPSTGGFINPFTVPSGALWRLAQARPGEKLRFRCVGEHEAQTMRRQVERLCTASSLVDLR
jgi:biotin-dependent carboxylase-like uncharacterized protein